MDYAVVHGNYLEEGGAEHVSHKLAEMYDATLYYGFGLPEEDTSTDAVSTRSLYNDHVLAGPLKRSILLRDIFYMWESQHIEELHDYDVLIFSKNELGWYVPPDEQIVIHYLHTTPRTPYDLFHQKGNSPVSKAYSLLARPLYLPNTKYPDLFIANSELVKRRAQRYWGIPDKKIRTVYPPVDTKQYEQRGLADYYLTFSRLIPEKRIDNIIRAFDGLDARLVVGGTGEQEAELKRISPDNVEFVGYMAEEEKIRRLGEAKALLFNAENEDFGMVPIEAFASGTPVIGVRDGYTKYQIRDGENGVLHEPDPASIREAVVRFEEDAVSWTRDEIQSFAERYSTERFEQELRESVEEAIEASAIDSK
jgi:glycosyltransferase involved in cell wall biosynthesis